MKRIFFCCSFFIATQIFPQMYKADWESLDARPVPQWFTNAKFGIFIHWGVYSVPGWSKKGDYAEWYQYGLQTTDSARMKFHSKKFGALSYYQIADQFKAELFNAGDWARLFERSGAKYIVLTSKHHDGFCLWPSKDANRTWGFPWNAVDVGPRRDLLGELFKAIRETSVHAGMYYSLYEWFNPLWKTDKIRYAAEHVWPQMKDLINNYQPDVFWTDGDWDASDEVWKSKEFLAWMYNESPVKDKVVTYDRWGSGIRFKHGAVFTPEYQPDLDFEDHHWEESRGMGYSYGYNREEDAWDYNSTQSLIIHLIDKVSRGGNFLLDIGPDEHGKIPPIMQERLLEIGDWLKINGEAIYGSTRWKYPSQWSAGRQDYKSKGGDVMLKLTVDPDPGYAVKEVFYTYNKNTNTLYAIFPKYPAGHQLVLKDMNIPAGTKLRFLSTKEEVQWKQQGEDIVAMLPEYDPGKMKAPYAYVVKIENYGMYSSKPKIQVAYSEGSLKPVVTLSAAEVETIRYTSDGSEPTLQSELYNKPFSLDKNAVIKAKTFMTGRLPGSVASENVIKYEWMKAVNVRGPKAGISYWYYEPQQNINLASVNSASSVQSGVVNEISLAKKQRADRFAFRFEGYVKIDKDDFYSFFTQSDDGSKLFIDDVEVVNNDGDHGAVEQSGRAVLTKGFHKLRVLYYDSGGGNELKVFMQREGGEKMEIPASQLYH